jgi:hypothetical protein
MTEWWNDDEGLGAALAEALAERTAVPASMVDAGKAAFAWHGVDAELAELRYDSAVGAPDAGYAAATRATENRPDTGTLRTLTFAAERLTVELDITADAILGQLIPAGAGRAELRTGDTTKTVEIDEDGWFTIRPIPTTQFRLRCTTQDGQAALTPWITPSA